MSAAEKLDDALFHAVLDEHVLTVETLDEAVVFRLVCGEQVAATDVGQRDVDRLLDACAVWIRSPRTLSLDAVRCREVTLVPYHARRAAVAASITVEGIDCTLTACLDPEQLQALLCVLASHLDECRRERERIAYDLQQQKIEAQRLAWEQQQKAEREAKARQVLDLEVRRLQIWRELHGDLPMPPSPDRAAGFLAAADAAFVEVDEGADERLRPLCARLDLWVGGRGNILAGLPNALKSVVAMAIAVAVAKGDAFVFETIPVSLSGDVAWLDFEGGAPKARQRAIRLGGEDCVAEGTLRILSPRISLLDEEAEEALTDLLWGVVAVFVDSLQAGCRMRAEHYDRSIGVLQRACGRTGTCLVIVSRVVKSDQRRGLDRLLDLGGYDADTVLSFDRGDGDSTVITSIKADRAKIEPLRLKLVEDGAPDAMGISERIRLVEVGGGKTAARVMSAGERVRRRILRALTDEPMTYTRLREEVTGGNAAVKQAVEMLVEAGEVSLDPETGEYVVEPRPSPSVCDLATPEIANEITVRGLSASDRAFPDPADVKKLNEITVHPRPFTSVTPPVHASFPPVGGKTRTDARPGKAKRKGAAQ